MSEHVSDCARKKKEKQANVRENPAQPVASGWASSFLLLRKGKKLQAGYSLCSNHGDLTKLVQGTGCWIVHKIIGCIQSLFVCFLDIEYWKLHTNASTKMTAKWQVWYVASQDVLGVIKR